MKFKRTNLYKVRWCRLEKELKDFVKTFPNKPISAQLILNTMENIAKKHLSKDVVSSRFILQKYPEMDRMRLQYGRKTGKLEYIKKGGMFFYKEADVVLWWNEYVKYVQKTVQVGKGEIK